MIINVKNEIEISTFQIIFKGSVINEKPGWYGLSHLMEHLICKPLDSLQNEFQRYNIEFNAYTSNTEIVFYLTGLDEYVNKYKYKMLDLILNYEVNEEDLSKEKKIVLEEYQDSFNDQISSHFLNLDRKLFNSYGPIGLRSDIEKFTVNDCKEYQSLYLNKPSMIINISKNYDFQNENIIFQNNVNNINYKMNLNNETINIKNKKDFNKIKNQIPLELINNFENNSSIIIVSDIINQDFNIIKYANLMLSSGLNSPLYDEIREKRGLVYYINSYIEKLTDDSGKIMIYTESSMDNVDEILMEIQNILNNKEKYLTQERFDIIYDNLKVKFKENEIFKHKHIEKYIDNDNWKMENILDTITLNDIYNVIDKYFKWDNLYKSVYQQEFS